MARTKNDPLDSIGWRLIEALERDGRAPLKTLSQEIGLSVAATAERLNRLLDEGVLRGIRPEVDHVKAGYAIKALIGITVQEPGKKAFLRKLEKMPEVIECHHVAGPESYSLTVVTESLVHLEHLIESINGYGETRTSIIFSTPIEHRGLKAVERKTR